MAPKNPQPTQRRLDSFFRPQAHAKTADQMLDSSNSPHVSSTDPTPSKPDTNIRVTSPVKLLRDSGLNSSPKSKPYAVSCGICPTSETRTIADVDKQAMTSITKASTESQMRVDLCVPPRSSGNLVSSPLSSIPASQVSSKRPYTSDDDNDDKNEEHPRKRRSRSPSVSLRNNASQKKFTVNATTTPTISVALAQSSKGEVFSSSLSSPISVSSEDLSLGRRRHQSLVISSSQDDEYAARPLIASADYDDSSYSSESSLEDIDVATGMKPKVTPQVDSAAHTHSNSDEESEDLGNEEGIGIDKRRRSKRIKSNSSRHHSFRHEESSMRNRTTPTYKYSLKKLIQSNESDLALQGQLAEVRAALTASISQEWDNANGLRNNSGTKDERGSQTIDRNLLESIVKHEDGEDDRAEKLMQAMNRTRAVQHEDMWCFLDPLAELDAIMPPFPNLSVLDFGDEALLLNDSFSREQLFLSGSANVLLSKKTLPSEVLLWFWKAAILESRDDLAEAYIVFLEAQTQYLEHLNESHIETFLLLIGARSAALATNETLKPDKRRADLDSLEYPHSLSAFLRVSGRISSRSSITVRSYLIALLFRLAADSILARDGALQSHWQNCLNRLIESIPHESCETHLYSVCERVFETVKSPALQTRLISLLPSSGQSLKKWRKYLALTFFLDDVKILRIPLDKPWAALELPGLISKHIDNDPLYPKSRLDSAVDFEAICIKLYLLDVGISDGFSTQLPTASDAHPAEKQHHQQRNLSRLAGFLVKDSQPGDARSIAIKAHNRQVDILYKAVQLLNGGIAETGVGNTARMDAKNVIARLLHRLDYSVRTKPRVRKGQSWMTDKSRSCKQESEQGIEAFLTKAKRATESMDIKTKTATVAKSEDVTIGMNQIEDRSDHEDNDDNDNDDDDEYVDANEHLFLSERPDSDRILQSGDHYANVNADSEAEYDEESSIIKVQM